MREDWEVSPSHWEESGRGLCPSLEYFFSIFELKKARFGASWLLFFAVD